MQEVKDRVLSQLRSVWRFRWQGAVVAWTVALAGFFIVYTLPDRYDATARVYIDADSVLRNLIKDMAPQGDMDSKVARVTRELLSRPNLEKVSYETDMHLRAKSPEEREDLLQHMAKAIEINVVGKNEFFISFADYDPKMAKRVVQALLNQFMEFTLGAKRTDSDEAQQFIEKQIKEYEVQLAAAEKRLEEFNRQNVGMLPSDGKNYYQSLQAEMSQLEVEKLGLREAENRRAELASQLQGEEPSFGFSGQADTVSDPVMAGYATRIEALQKKLDDLLLTYTDQHPDVIATRNTIKQLEEQRDKAAASRPAINAPQLEANPVYQQAKIALGQAEADAASKRTRVAEYEKRVQSLRDRVDAIPQVESQLAGLNRDYQSIKKTYDQLLNRREAAKLGDSAEQNTQEMKFRVIEPAFVPIQPSGPDRKLFYLVVLVASLGLGLAFGLMQSQLSPTFDNRKILREDTGLPVLGYVSMIWTTKELVRRRVGYMAFLGSILGLVAIYAVLLTMELKGVRLWQILAWLKGGFS